MRPQHDEGKYVVEIIDQGMGVTTNGNVQFVLKFKVLGKVDPANPNNYFKNEVQSERAMYRVINENTIDFALDELRVLGFEGSSFSQLDPKDSKHVSFVGHQVDMQCQHKADLNNQPKEEWSVFRGGGVLIRQEASPEQLRQLDYLFSKRLKELRPEKAAPAPAAKSTAAPARGARPMPVAQGVTDDDVPF